MKKIHNFLQKKNTFLQKIIQQSKEDLYLEDYLNPESLNPKVTREPFPHIYIENFLKEDSYQKVLSEFRDIQKRGYSSDIKEIESFHQFEIDYDGYVFMPIPSLDKKTALHLFFSVEWNLFFSKLFKQHTDFETSLAFHHHPIGDNTGFVHHDLADKPFYKSEQLKNKVIPSSRDPKKQNGLYKKKRIIALIYYVNNSDWQEGDGGETGLYSSDKKTLLKKIPPISNSLLAFQISEKSMHAFQKNLKERNCVVQWFHIDEKIL
jgi:hypothetical protein